MDSAPRHGRWWVPILGGIVAFAAFDALMRRFDVEVPPTGTLRVVQAERLGETGIEPPAADSPGWVPRTLPDAFLQPGQRVYIAWYRLRVDLDPARHALWAVYLHRPETVVAVRVNGQPVGDAGTTRDPLPHYLADLRFAVPASLLNAGSNEILVRTARIPDYGYLGEVWVGDNEALARMQRRLELLGRDTARVAATIVGVLALLHGAFYLLRRRESAYGWFGGALFAWALHCAWPLFDLPPIPMAAWWPLSMISLGWFTILAAGFVHRFLGLHRPLVERGLLAFGVVGSAVLWVGSFARRVEVDAFAEWIWIPSFLVIGAYQVYCFASAMRRRRGWELRLIGAFAVFLLLVGVRDYAYDWGLLASSAGRYFRYAGSFVLVVFGIVLMRRFVAALDHSEQLARNLEARVAENSAVIASNYRRIAEMERERARVDERERIVRDMHDGIGGQLVQALAMSERGAEPARMHEVIQGCLDDLRLVIDTGAAGPEGLAAILASLRNRVRRRLDGSGLAVDWPLGDVDRLPRLSSHAALQVVRVLQEALSNVLKHARATRVSVRCEVDGDGALSVRVRDDGCGIDPAAPPGRGLANMRRRAADLGAALEIESGPGGTELRFRVPPAVG